MIGSLIVAAALMAQQPPRPTAARAAESAPEARKLIEKRRAKKAAAYAGRLDREYKEAVAAERAAAAARKEYKEMLPYLLENQRQALQRQTDLERNQVLNRLAGAAERQAGYVYPGQSPTIGPYR